VAKYGTFKYGDGTKYGAGEQTANLRWGFIVAWDGYYGWGNEANRMVGLTVRRGRPNLLRGNGKGFEPFHPGTFTATLDNEDGRYDPFNTSSPLYPNVTPGKFCRLVVYDETLDAQYSLMHGIVKDIQPIRQGSVERVRIVVEDGLDWLSTKWVYYGLTQNVAKGFAPAQILSRVEWPTAHWGSSITNDPALQDYWWAWNQNAHEALQEWSTGEAAVAFHSRDGDLVWRPKLYPYHRSLTLDQSDILDEIGRPQPWEAIINNVRTEVRTKKVDAGPYTLWSLSDTITLDNGETFYVEPMFKYEEWTPCGGAVTFTHTVNAQADGGGADLTSNCPLWFDAHIGEGARLSVTNNSGSNGHIIALYASGQAIYPPHVDTIISEDVPSQGAYGERTLVMDSRWIEDPAEAQVLTDWLLDELKDPEVLPIIQVEGRSHEQFYPDLWDRIVLNVSELSIADREYRVGEIEHQWLSENGQSVRTTFRLEPYLFYNVTEDVVTFSGMYAYDTLSALADQTTVNVTAQLDEIYDTDDFFDGTTVTIPSTGYYMLNAHFHMTMLGAVTGNNMYVEFYNATTAEIIARGREPMGPHAVFIEEYANLCITYLLTEGDEIQVRAYQNNEPADLNIPGIGIGGRAHLHISKLGE
jgi:hypothetical protein